jgi:hypothetical protein
MLLRKAAVYLLLLIVNLASCAEDFYKASGLDSRIVNYTV